MENMNPIPQIEDGVEVFTPYITRNGKKIYHPMYFSHGKVYHFFAKPRKSKVTKPPEDQTVN